MFPCINEHFLVYSMLFDGMCDFLFHWVHSRSVISLTNSILDLLYCCAPYNLGYEMIVKAIIFLVFCISTLNDDCFFFFFFFFFYF